jgi:beta-glucosidase
LSYTTFTFDNLRVEPKQILTGGTAKVSVDVTNSGQREGDEVAQLYLHQRIADVTQPVMQLKDFDRITLEARRKENCRLHHHAGDAFDPEHRHASRG